MLRKLLGFSLVLLLVGAWLAMAGSQGRVPCTVSIKLPGVKAQTIFSRAAITMPVAQAIWTGAFPPPCPDGEWGSVCWEGGCAFGLCFCWDCDECVAGEKECSWYQMY